MAIKEVMAFDAAKAEITNWLDYKRVKDTQRTANEGSFNSLVEAMQYGDITMDSTTFIIKQKLAVPITGLDMDSLEHKPRITVSDIQRNMANVKANDVVGMGAAYVAAITGKAPSHIQKMDTEDYKVAQAISVFFM